MRLLSNCSKTALIVVALFLPGLNACKSKSSSPKPANNNTGTAPDTTDKQRELDEAQQRNAAKSITLDGKSNGETISVASADLGGGLGIVVSGLAVEQLTVALLDGSPALKIVGDSTSAGFKLQGSLPAGVTTPTPVSIFARDRAACKRTSATDCDVVGDSNNRAATSQFVINPAYDVQATFNVQPTTAGTTNNGGLNGLFGGNGGTGTGNGTTGGFWNSITQRWQSIKDWFGGLRQQQ